MEGCEVFGRAVHVGVVNILVQVVSDLAVEGRIAHQAHDVTGNAANVVVLHGFQGLNEGFDDSFHVSFNSFEGSTFVDRALEESSVEFGRHGVDMVVGTSGHDVTHAESVKVELCGFLHDLLVGVQVDSGRGNGDCATLAGGSCSAVVLGNAVLESLILDGTACRIAGIRLGLQTGRQGVLLNVADHKTGKFRQVYLRGTSLDQGNSFSSCHSKSHSFQNLFCD